MKLNFMNNKLKIFQLYYDFKAFFKFIFMKNNYFNNDRDYN